MSVVTMINSVGEHVAGTEVDLPDELADSYILKGYAEGLLSRKWDPSEVAEIQANHQVVNV